MAKIIYGSNDEITLDYGEFMTLFTKGKFCEYNVIVETSKNEYLSVDYITEAENGEVLTLNTKGNTCDSNITLRSTERYYFTVNGSSYSVSPDTTWAEYIEDENSPFYEIFEIYYIYEDNICGVGTGNPSKPILVDSNGDYVDYYSDIKSDDYSYSINKFTPIIFAVQVVDDDGYELEEFEYDATINTWWQDWYDALTDQSIKNRFQMNNTDGVYYEYGGDWYYLMDSNNDCPSTSAEIEAVTYKVIINDSNKAI